MTRDLIGRKLSLLAVRRRRADDWISSLHLRLAHWCDWCVGGCESSALDSANGSTAIATAKGKRISGSRVAAEELMAGLVATEGANNTRVEMVEEVLVVVVAVDRKSVV